MINKQDLYNKIMENVAQVVKRTLDETFTTYPWNKVQNYIAKVQNDLCICISFDNDQFPNPPYDWLKTHDLDDQKYIVYSLTHEHISSVPQYLEDIKKSLQLVGLNYSKSYIDNQTNKEMLVFIPKKQNAIDIENINGLNYLYHICPHYVTEKIKAIGFVPKSKNKLFDYDPRIHFFFQHTPIEEMQLIRKQLDDNNDSISNNHEYDLIKIKIPKGIKFFKDLDCMFGLYTNENINPSYIQDITPIESIDELEYANWRFGLSKMFN